MKKILGILLIVISLMWLCKPVEKTFEYHKDIIGQYQPIKIHVSKRRARIINKKLKKSGCPTMKYKNGYVYLLPEHIKCNNKLFKTRELKNYEIN